MSLGGRATRVELYGCLLLVAITVELMYERLIVDRLFIDKLIVDGERPIMIQANQQEVQVNFEHPVDKMVREIEAKRNLLSGKKESIVSGTNSSSGASGYSDNQQRVPANSDAVDRAGK